MSRNPRLKNLTGLRFSRLIVIEQHGRNACGLITWKCVCDCGATTISVGQSLNSKQTKSCGCLRNDNRYIGKHGGLKGRRTIPEYHSWASAKKRVTNPNDRAYERYGGRGIGMCDRWLNSFAAFLSDMGRKPSPIHSLDRYPDNNGNYEPGNCRWATPTEQARNRRPARPRRELERYTAGK